MIDVDLVVQIVEALGGSRVSVQDRHDGEVEVSACCPFHSERTPSFGVAVGKGVYNCFGCGATGTLRHLAREAGIALGDAPSLWVRKRSVRAVSTGALPSEFRALRLDTPRTRSEEIIAAYMGRRGVSQEEVDRWGIGWCPRGRYGGCVVFPVAEPGGKVASFVARAVPPLRTPVPKYLNAPTPIGDELWGWETIREGEEVRIVEGVFDALAVHRHLGPAVALLGKAMGRGRIELLRQLRPASVTVLLDADAWIRARALASDLRFWWPAARADRLEAGDPADAFRLRK